ncbi:MAG TPA: hypothetical protein VJX10_08840 [Pseudonocardiaceae bacterium]|nr:hypothetical protein [Pseudonocardiaceae bacterium]
MAVAVAGCGAGLADGPRMRICGDWIGRAEILGGSGPFYVNGVGRPPTIQAAAGSSPIWVRVSPSCQHGATVATSNPAVISVAGTVAARDGTDVAVLVAPRTAGHAVLTATVPHLGTERVAFAIGGPLS